jgi:hypothetical protein
VDDVIVRVLDVGEVADEFGEEDDDDEDDDDVEVDDADDVGEATDGSGYHVNETELGSADNCARDRKPDTIDANAGVDAVLPFSDVDTDEPVADAGDAGSDDSDVVGDVDDVDVDDVDVDDGCCIINTCSSKKWTCG